jgi:polyadenylate-binding protein 2
MELSNVQSYANALALDESIFMGRQLKVLPKRTNVPGLTRHAHSGKLAV